jgi:hypothetical protein
MRKVLFPVLLFLMLAAHAVAAAADSVAVNIPDETLNYKVMFKWGFINKKAGSAKLSLRRTPQGYTSQLTAASEPWADRIYRLRDTLNGRMEPDGFRPLFYEKIAHEGAEHKHDVVTYDYTHPGVVAADCSRKVFNKGVLKIDERRRMEAEDRAVDMLTSFYFMRSLPFQDMLPGESTSVAIFSGKQKETLTIDYVGIENVEVDGGTYPAYHVTFLFTTKGGRQSSDSMDAWIATGPGRIPLKLEGKLPVGKVRCYFTGKDDASSE